MKERTLTKLREFDGRIYVYLDNEKICKRFLQEAENEGYRFGKIKPTQSGGSNIIALKKNKQLSYVGFVGHVEFQCNGGDGGNLIRVNYEKYINGDANFLFENSPFKPLTIKGNFFEKVTIIGDNANTAAGYIMGKCVYCNNEDEEFNLHGEAEERFDVSIFTEAD